MSVDSSDLDRHRDCTRPGCWCGRTPSVSPSSGKAAEPSQNVTEDQLRLATRMAQATVAMHYPPRRAESGEAATPKGEWVHCSPSLLNAGVDCGLSARRAGPDGIGHEHFIASRASSEEVVKLQELVDWFRRCPSHADDYPALIAYSKQLVPSSNKFGWGKADHEALFKRLREITSNG